MAGQRTGRGRAPRPPRRRRATEEKESRHFAVRPNELLLFFDNLFPIRLSALLWLPSESDRGLASALRRSSSSSLSMLDPARLVRRAIPEDMLKILEVMPRFKDGGAYVKLRHDEALPPKEVEERLLQRLQQHRLKPWFSPFRGITARLVRGSPWLEDLYRFPSPLLKVEFIPQEPGTAAADLSEEVLYSLFRRYGKLADITPQAWDSKELPRHALVSFPRLRDAIMARNCLHGFILEESKGGGKAGTLLRLSYVKRLKAHNIWNWLTNHPRIVVPLAAALLAGISVVIFDPIRTFFVKAHVQHSLRFTDSRLYKWFKSRAEGISFGGGSGKKDFAADGLSTIWNHRRDLIDQLRGWLDGSSDTFIVITGPTGSGKVEMVVDQALAGRANVLMFDCKPVADANGEAATIKRLATAVGYRLVFSWANSMSSMIDFAVQSTTGVKAGFSETFESQLNKILHTTAAALKEVALSGRSSIDKDANLSDDAFFEAHPERWPVIVVDNFLHTRDSMMVLYNRIAEWAASLVQNNVAHVVFLTSDAAYSKLLAQVMPDRVFRTISLGDLDHAVTKKYVTSRLQEGDQHHQQQDEAHALNTDGLDDCIATLGGRLTDLEFLSRRIKAGKTPRQAVTEIVDESATDIVLFLLAKPSDGEPHKWTSQQAWHLVKALADTPTLRYNQTLLAPAFAASADPDAALDALAATELVALTSRGGRPQLVRGGKPLYQAAFGVLLRDRALHARMDLAALAEQAKAGNAALDRVEAELALFGALPRQPAETTGRLNYLLGKLDAGQRNIEALEKEMAGLKRVLSEEA